MKVAACAAAFVGQAVAAPGGTCGYQCTTDSDCSGCGSAGSCSYPHGKDASYLPTMTSCVSAPSEKLPKEPVSSVDDSAWPDQWSANLYAWTYPGWESNSSDSEGKFLYDKRYGSKVTYTKLRGKTSHTIEAWNANVDGIDKMFFNQNGFCIGFNITDPGISGTNKVGIERADWMKRCHEAGFAKYVGRELVTVDEKEEWADHYSCRIPYDKVNQSITFQNWHSLGLGSVAKGLPLRVTGGNSQPDPQQSPRLNSVWHSNFTIGAGSSTPADFQWNPMCNGSVCFGCPMTAAADVEDFFGHLVGKAHMSSPAFMSRARFLRHATASTSDLKRAAQPKPGSAFQGSSFKSTMQKLNSILLRDGNLTTKPCADFNLQELHELEALLFDARSPQLNRIYSAADDTRRMAHQDLSALHAEQTWRVNLSGGHARVARDGLCHELVMWFVHHLSTDARKQVKSQAVLPLLPEVHHAANSAHTVDQRYNQQVSCAICHVAPSVITV